MVEGVPYSSLAEADYLLLQVLYSSVEKHVNLKSKKTIIVVEVLNQNKLSKLYYGRYFDLYQCLGLIYITPGNTWASENEASCINQKTGYWRDVKNVT